MLNDLPQLTFAANVLGQWNMNVKKILDKQNMGWWSILLYRQFIQLHTISAYGYICYVESHHLFHVSQIVEGVSLSTLFCCFPFTYNFINFSRSWSKAAISWCMRKEILWGSCYIHQKWLTYCSTTGKQVTNQVCS